MNKYKLTEEHRKQLKPWAEKWIKNGLRTRPMDEYDRQEMRRAIKGLYEAANLTPPPEHRIVFVPSPFVARFAGGFAAAIWWLRKNKKEDVNKATRATTHAATNATTDAATYAATDDATYAAAFDATNAAINAATYDATDAATESATYAAADEATDAATESATRAATRVATEAATYKKESNSNNYFNFDVKGMKHLSKILGLNDFGLKCAQDSWRMYQGGNFWSGWVSFISFFRHIAKLDIDYSKWKHWESAAVHGSYRIMHNEFCLVSDFPTKILQDEENRGHNFDGPYIEWSDGSGIYQIHGFNVPAWVCETKREDFTADMILNTKDVDVRRCIIQKLGIEKTIELLGAETIDTYESDIGGKYELLMVDYDGTGEKRPYLKMENKSTGEFHIEGVATTNIKDAIKFRNGLKKSVEPELLT